MQQVCLFPSQLRECFAGLCMASMPVPGMIFCTFVGPIGHGKSLVPRTNALSIPAVVGVCQSGGTPPVLFHLGSHPSRPIVSFLMPLKGPSVAAFHFATTWLAFAAVQLSGCHLFTP